MKFDNKFIVNKNPRLIPGEIYHIYNHSNGDEEIFLTKKTIKRFIEVIKYYRFNQKIRYSQFKLMSDELKKFYSEKINSQRSLIDIYAYAVMPNHYHLLIKQIKEKGILKYVTNFQNSYAKYFNKLNNRRGSVFITSFKRKRITSQEQFIHVSRYIHLNPVTDYLLTFNELKISPNTSLPFYLFDYKRDGFIKSKKLLSCFNNERKKYFKFITDNINYQRNLAKIKMFLLE